jgi:hypothetical protein
MATSERIISTTGAVSIRESENSLQYEKAMSGSENKSEK